MSKDESLYLCLGYIIDVLRHLSLDDEDKLRVNAADHYLVEWKNSSKPDERVVTLMSGEKLEL